MVCCRWRTPSKPLQALGQSPLQSRKESGPGYTAVPLCWPPKDEGTGIMVYLKWNLMLIVKEIWRNPKVQNCRYETYFFFHILLVTRPDQIRQQGNIVPLDGEATHTFIVGDDTLHLWRWLWLILGITCNPVHSLKVTFELSNSHWSSLNLSDHQNSLISSENSWLYQISSFVPGAWKKCQWGWQKYTHRYWASLVEMQDIPGHS